MAKFVVIGERLSATAPAVNKAFTERDPEPILLRAKQQLDAGATYLDVNIGPAENDGEDLMAAALPALHLYFFGYFMMSLQFAGQSVFVALGKSKQAVFFSLFRKVMIVVPLTLILPHVAGLGAAGVFLAEPVSNFVGGTACFVTMYLTVYRKLDPDRKAKCADDS